MKKLLILYSKGHVCGQWSKTDQPLVMQELSDRGINVLVRCVDDALLEEDGIETLIAGIPWNEVAVIDYRYCSGVPRHWNSHYHRFFYSLQTRLNELEQDGHDVEVTPSIATLEWVLSKVRQVKAIERAGIPTIPYRVISHADDFEPIFINSLNALESDKWVLKPDIGSGGDRICFINQNETGFSVTVYRVDFHKNKHKQSKHFAKKNEWVAYISHVYIPSDFPIILQPLLDVKREISAVYIDGLPHFIERLPAEGHHIAHERFGGKNIYVCQPKETWGQLAEEVFHAIPRSARHSISLRLDFFETHEGLFYFSEVEAASNRILLPITLDYYRQDEDTPIQPVAEIPPSFFVPFKRYTNALYQRLTRIHM
ncbi:MAG: hypothetical protein GY801_26610 [bacterium]|nr:hypothetical protein [bacterium]